MTEFSYKDLFAKSAPKDPPRAASVARAKYDFAVAYPDPDSLPLDDLADSLKSALVEEGRDLAVYPHQQGYPPLREYVASKLERDREIRVGADEIVLADGSSQPLHMVGESLLDPGDVVLTEEFVYVGTLAMLRRFQADIRGVQCDEDGLLPDALEDAIVKAVGEGKRPKFIYTIPTFQNPLGWTMTLERRQALVELSHKYDVPILEDDCYVDLRYEGEPVPAIHSLDDTGRVMYVASFSKNIAPGMRLGYLTGPQDLMDVARAAKKRRRRQPVRGAGGPPLRRQRQAGRAHRRVDRDTEDQERRHAGRAGGELRHGGEVEPSGRRPVHLAGDA